MEHSRVITVLCIILAVWRIQAQTNSSTGLTFVSREQWGALPPSSQVPNLTVYPPLIVTVESCYNNENCVTQEDCKNEVRKIQNATINIWRIPDIQYHFLIGGDGAVYEGRHWHLVADNVTKYDVMSLKICLLGFFRVQQPAAAALTAAQNLIKYAVDNEKLNTSYILVAGAMFSDPHDYQDVFQGQLIKEIQKWPHYFTGEKENSQINQST